MGYYSIVVWVLPVFSLSRNQQTAPLPPSSTFLRFVSPSLNYFFIVLLGRRNKPGSHVFAYSLTASNIKRTNLTWLPLEIIHRGHSWHDYPWPWVSLTWILYNCPRRWFRKFIVRFRPIRKEIVSWTLGARDFSGAVSGFCQVFIMTRAKSLWSRALLLWCRWSNR